MAPPIICRSYCSSVASLSWALPFVFVLLILLSTSASAQGVVAQTAGPVPGKPAGVMPNGLKGITIQQKLNTQIPLDLHFRDETGRDVTLRQDFDKRPVILNFVYFRCPMLCPEAVRGLARSLARMTFQAGRQTTVLTVSFDPGDTPTDAAEKKKAALEQLGQRGAAEAWHFLTGDQASIRALTDAAGFVYAGIPPRASFSTRRASCS